MDENKNANPTAEETALSPKEKRAMRRAERKEKRKDARALWKHLPFGTRLAVGIMKTLLIAALVIWGAGFYIHHAGGACLYRKKPV